MKRKMIMIMCIVCLIMLNSFTSYAIELTTNVVVNPTNKEITVSGNATSGVMLTIAVFPENIDPQLQGDGDSSGVNFGQTMAYDGVYTYVFTLLDSLEKANYVVYVTSADTGVTVQDKFFHASDTEMLSALAQINCAKTSTELGNKIDVYYNELLLPVDDYGKLGMKKATVNEMMILLRPSTGFANTLEVNKTFQKAVSAVAVSVGSVSDTLNIINKYGTFIGLDLSKLSNIPALAKEFALAIVNKDTYTTYDMFKDGYDESIICGLVSKPDNYAEIKTALLETYSFKLSLSATRYNTVSNKDEVFRAMLDKDYYTIDEVKNGFYTAVDNQIVAEKQSSVTGASSRSGSPSIGTSVTSSPSPSENSDIDSVPWAKSYIEALNKRGIMNGDGNGLFKPLNNVTRAEFAKMLVVALGLNGDASNAGFTDVSSSDWYYTYVEKAANCGIIKGKSLSEFAPQEQITRQDMAVMTKRAIDYLNIELSEKEGSTELVDQSEISDYASESVLELKNAGMINGTGNGYFEPFNNSSRAEAAKIIYSLIALKGGEAI